MTTIIAEIGANHLGCADRAKEYIDALAKQGVEWVKIQQINPDTLASPQAELANTKMLQRAMLWRCPLPWTAVEEIIEHAHDHDMKIGVTAFTERDAREAVSSNADFFKMASPDMLSYDMWRIYMNDEQKRPIFCSTGGHDELRIRTLFTFLHVNADSLKNRNVVLFHCAAKYPADDFYLRRWMILYKKVQDYNITNGGNPVLDMGYSDHGSSWDLVRIAKELNPSLSWLERHVYMNDQDIDTVCATPLPGFKVFMDEFRSDEYGRLAQFSDEHSSKFSRRYWCATTYIKPGRRLVPGQNITLQRCMTKERLLRVSDMLDSSYRAEYFQDEKLVARTDILTGDPVYHSTVEPKV